MLLPVQETVTVAWGTQPCQQQAYGPSLSRVAPRQQAPVEPAESMAVLAMSVEATSATTLAFVKDQVAEARNFETGPRCPRLPLETRIVNTTHRRARRSLLVRSLQVPLRARQRHVGRGLISR